MAFETLVDASVRFPGDCGGDHLEVHHVMAGRSLVALGAVTRIAGGVSEIGNGPAVGCMAGRTVSAK